MTRPDPMTALQDALNDLTPEEREMLAASTPADWLAVISADLTRDPGFWQGIGTAFLEGLANGVNDYLDIRR